jgi:formylglycine-generating enzyme required for sulfatase activity
MLIAFKLKLALACAAGLAGPLAAIPLTLPLTIPLVSDRDIQGGGAIVEPAMVELGPGTMTYRVAGDFTRAGKPAEAPLITLRVAKPLAIMQHQVGAADYQACVDAGACRALERGVAVAVDRPAVQVSWHDAQAYAAWLSRKTGEHYRLPTDAEWAFAASSKFRDDGLAVDDNDPSKRWIARYERESGGSDDSATRAFGAFGVNEHGLSDLAGNVWEWTATCFERTVLDEAGNAVRQSPNCGVRVAEGAHRAYVTDFIRDARAGGCASGVPPSNLGFRLVRDPASWIGRVAAGLNKALESVRS